MIPIQDIEFEATPASPSVMRPGQAIFTAGVHLLPGIRAPAARPFTSSPSRVDAVRLALADGRFDFRRPESLARELDLSLEEVRAILERTDVARRPWGRPGSDIFTSVDRPVSVRERLSLLDVFVAKRPV